MKLGIVGLPNVGKTTLFNALTNSDAESANYPYSTTGANIGAVTVPDKRLDFLKELHSPKKYTPATIEFVDIAGLARGASRGEGMGNKFLSHIRMTDAIIHVVRCFDDPDVAHIEEGGTNPLRDIEIINLELVLADVEMVQRRIERAKKAAKGDKKYIHEAEVFERLLAHMDDGSPARLFDCSHEDMEIIQTSELLSLKPVIYAANMGESDIADGIDNSAYYTAVKKQADSENTRAFAICAKIEQELVSLSAEDKELFLSELGIGESGLYSLIRESYALLGLISFLTCGPDEVRAWTIKDGTVAQRAAGKIHSDIERGFIRAEIVSFADLEASGTMAAAKERGLVRLEGKEYVMRDGDVVNFRFNV